MLSLVILGILVFAAFLIIVLALVFRKKPQAPPDKKEIDSFLEVIRRKSGFTKPEPVSAPRGKCLNYIFPVELTVNVKEVDKLEPVPSDVFLNCLDEDQATLAKVYSTCTLDYCIGYQGERIEKGESILLYSPCSGLEPCYEYDQSYLAGISIDNKCITRGEKIEPEVCSLFDKKQLWRVNRVIPLSLVGNSKGILARIYNRLNGKCLIPAVTPPSVGTGLKEADCFPNKGYVWWILPPVVFTENGETFESLPQLVYTSNSSFFPENLPDYLETNDVLSVHLRGDALILDKYKKKPDISSLLKINKYADIT